jgi:peptidoglycan/xylan/chitin deacetylase (PgdA/CDA1 family)
MLTVSNYHYIRENFDLKYPSIFGMTPVQFRNQIQGLKKTGDFVRIYDLLSHTEDILTSNKNYYLITFDDGLKEQYIHALPIMEELNVDGLFFVNSINHEEKKVSTVHKIHLLRSEIHPKEILAGIKEFTDLDYSNEEKSKAHKVYRFDTKESAEVKYFLNFIMPYDQKELLVNTLFQVYFNEMDIAESLYMDMHQIKDLAERRYIGNHTHSHKPLGLFDEETITYELSHSKKFLEKITGQHIETVSYPYGTAAASSKIVQQLSKKTGHKLGFTALKGMNRNIENLMALSRFDCNDLIGGKNYGN